ncbi:MAG: anhydro-N-acetylmuramic acid kinase [Propionibacteriaceae bacterium]
MTEPRAAPTVSTTTRVIGLISGTSVDGIDVAVADLWLDGDVLRLVPVAATSYSYSPGLRHAITTALPPARVAMAEVCALDTTIGTEFAAAAVRAQAELAVDRPADLVVSHGQTVFHWVTGGRTRGTLQLGQPAWIAAATGLPVIADLRSADVAAGGQGAPLVSLVDVLWLRSRPGRPVAVNLGGIANLTARIDTDTPVAYDVGPANALIDAVVAAATDGAQRYDAEGARAAAGTVDQGALDRLMSDPYFTVGPPKSTGKERFHLGYLSERLGTDWLARTTVDDAVATLTALTGATVAAAVTAEAATEVVLSGGGTANPTMLAGIRTRLGGTPLRTSDELGLPSAAKEAYAFVVLGWLGWHGLPGTVPSCTGAQTARILGSFTPGRTPLRLPEPLDRAPSRLVICRFETAGSTG